jgi:hypothetical protein
MLTLEGMTVVTLEHAVAAPFATRSWRRVTAGASSGRWWDLCAGFSPRLC